MLNEQVTLEATPDKSVRLYDCVICGADLRHNFPRVAIITAETEDEDKYRFVEPFVCETCGRIMKFWKGKKTCL